MKERYPRALGLFSVCLSLVLMAACSSDTQLASSSASPLPEETPKQYQLTVLHTNDHHGRFWPNRHDEYGLAARKTLVDQIRKEVAESGGYSLLLSGGDINTGVPESDMQDAEPDFKGMSEVGYDAMAVGNHEFDNSLEVVRKQQGWSNFPFLSANTYGESGERLFDPYKIFNFGDLNIAVIGFTTHRTATIGNPKHIEGMTFTLPELEAEPIVRALEESTDMIIAATHMGHHQYDQGSDITLAASVDGFDLIVGGHSAEPICVDEQGRLIEDYEIGSPCFPDNVNDTWIVQAHEWGKYVGRADFLITETEDASESKIELTHYELIPVNLKKEINGERQLVGDYITPDPELKAMLELYQAKGGESLSGYVGLSEGLFDPDDFTDMPNSTPLGEMIAEAFKLAAGADIGFTNHGGLRDSLYPGEITVKQVLQIMPFGNTVIYSDFTGSELIAYLESVRMLPMNQYKLQFSGVEFIDGELIYNETGKALDPEATYRVAMNNFMAQGGDGAEKIIYKDSYVDTGLVDYLVFQEYLTDKKTVSPDMY